MGQYKVPQDVEAEDKIIGPLTIRQFIYAVIGVAWAGLMFAIFKKVPFLVVLLGAPPALLFMLLAFYKHDGQDFEHFLVALVSYFGNSRRRYWIKEPVVEAFKLTPPKVTTTVSQRNPAEVRSQLESLAGVMDSRGGLNQLEDQAAADDRLFTPEQPAAEQVNAEANQVDILDLQHSPGAQTVTNLLDESAEQHRQDLLKQVQTQAAEPTPAAITSAAAPTTSTMTAPVSGAIIQLAKDNPELPISQIADQAHRITPLSEGEMVNITNGPSNTPQ